MGTGMNEQDSGFMEMLHDMGLPRTMLCDVMTRMGYERKSMRKLGEASDVKSNSGIAFRRAERWTRQLTCAGVNACKSMHNVHSTTCIGRMREGASCRARRAVPRLGVEN
jgi:hypothetical protein